MPGTRKEREEKRPRDPTEPEKGGREATGRESRNDDTKKLPETGRGEREERASVLPFSFSLFPLRTFDICSRALRVLRKEEGRGGGKALVYYCSSRAREREREKERERGRKTVFSSRRKEEEDMEVFLEEKDNKRI